MSSKGQTAHEEFLEAVMFRFHSSEEYLSREMITRYEHIDSVDVIAQFASDGESRYRYRLGITLTGSDPTGKAVCAVMQNPSYAGENVADKSVQFLEKVVFTKGLPEFQGVRHLIVVNQFAYIQTNDFEGLPHQIGELNDGAIKTALDEFGIVVLAWGSSNRRADGTMDSFNPTCLQIPFDCVTY